MKYFTEKEFERCTPSCKVSQMDASFLRILDVAREFSNVPFVLLSAYRSPEWDRKRGRSGRGFHTKGCAVDVVCKDGVSRLKIIRACIDLGLSVGVYSSFLHIDSRDNQIVFYGK